MMLFEQRARSSVTDFRITSENSAAVEKIVRRLEGLPLPIELAAARLRAMSVDQILQKLDDRFQLLTRGSRNAPARQQTLAQSIDWSFDLCTPPEKSLWANSSVFAGSFDLGSVEGILADEAQNDDLGDLVMSLVDKSILIREQNGSYVRYRLLETLRDYGRELVSVDEWVSLQRRHSEWFRQLVFRAGVDWTGPHQIDWMTRIDRDLPNVRTALEFGLTEPDSVEDTLRTASALHDYWLARGRFNEGRYWLGRALAEVPELTEGTLGEAVVEAAATGALLAALQRDIASATSIAEEARRQAEMQRNDDGRILARYTLGFVAVADGDLVRGAEYLEQGCRSIPGKRRHRPSGTRALLVRLRRRRTRRNRPGCKHLRGGVGPHRIARRNLVAVDDDVGLRIRPVASWQPRSRYRATRRFSPIASRAG